MSLETRSLSILKSTSPFCLAAFVAVAALGPAPAVADPTFKGFVAGDRDQLIAFSDQIGLEDRSGLSRRKAGPSGLVRRSVGSSEPAWFEAGERIDVKSGDYLVLCFQPDEEAVFRIDVTAVSGASKTIFPTDEHKGDSDVLIAKGGYEYCIGDAQSPVTLKFQSNGELGEGVVSITANTDLNSGLPELQQSLEAAKHIVPKAGGVARNDSLIYFRINYNLSE